MESVAHPTSAQLHCESSHTVVVFLMLRLLYSYWANAYSLGDLI